MKERVVYPGQGVGEIIEISEKKFKDEMLTYYVIYFDESDMTVLVPAKRKLRWRFCPKNLTLFQAIGRCGIK